MKIKRYIASTFACALICFGLQSVTSCSGHNEHDGHHHDEAAGEHHESEHEHEGKHEHADGEIVIEPDHAAEYGIQTTEAQLRPFAATLRTWGEIEPATLASGVASATSAGIVTLRPGISVGEHISANQVIATVSGKDMAGGDATSAAATALNAAQREVNRLKPLFEEGLATAAEYNAALAALETAQAAMPRHAGASGSAISPVGGVITQLLVTPGQYVEAGQAIATIASSSRVTLRADMPARLADRLPLVNDAVITTQTGNTIRLSEHGGRRSSSVESVAQNGYIPVFFTFDNNGTVVPGTAVEVYLTTAERPGVIALPVDAVGEQQDRHYVYVKTGDHAYRKRFVTLGDTDGQSVEITSGVTPGEEIVTQGAVCVRLAEASGAVPEGHSHHH